MPTETTPAPTLVERLQNVRCDRQPFTAEHKLCICRLTNKAAAEIERLSRELLEANVALNEMVYKSSFDGGWRCACFADHPVAAHVAAYMERSVLSPKKDQATPSAEAPT